MEKTIKKDGSWLLLIGVLAGWFALITQLYITLHTGTGPIQGLLVRYFSYFTILTNLLVVLSCTILLLNRKNQGFFTNPKTLTAFTVYITVVGLIYNLLLRHQWQPQGIHFVADQLLHVVVPVLFILYWLVFVQKSALAWKDTLVWLIYPFIYFLYILFQGTISGFYPYPFIDVAKLGYQHVFINSIYMLFVFLGLSLLFVWIARLTRKPNA